MSMEGERNNIRKSMFRSHTSMSIRPKMSVSRFMGYLKGKGSLLIFQKFGKMKFSYRNREFWFKGYYVDTTGKKYSSDKELHKESIKSR